MSNTVTTVVPVTAATTAGPDLSSYDTIIVAFSGGKDSLACLLHLLDLGVPREKIELWHHDVDGREGSDLMDWAPTRAYCRAVAQAFNVPIYFSWLEGGFEREMLRDQSAKAATIWEQPDGTLGRSGGAGKPGTRLRYPQVSADLSVRWCSAYLKIDVCAAAIRGQARFDGRRTLVVTGERAQESAARAKYKTFEPHRADPRAGRTLPVAGGRPPKRHVDQWRPIHAWDERCVWATIERWRVTPHPAYRTGFGRVSCQFCIFGSADQWASARAISPERFERVAAFEERFGTTIQRKESVRARADRGTPYPMSAADLEACRRETVEEPVLQPPGEWRLPAGAYGESCGPS